MNYAERLAALRRGWRRLGRNRLQRRVDQVANRPHAISDPENHRWRHPQGFMRAAQIVERDVQAHSGKVAIDLFAKAVRQAREPL